MIAGQLPFSGSTLAAVILSITAINYADPAQHGITSPLVHAFFAQAFSSRQAARFQTATELATCFERLSSDGDGMPARIEQVAPPGGDPWVKKMWMVRSADGDAEVGPVSLRQLVAGLKAGKLPLDAVVAKVNMDDWDLASLVLVREATMLQGGGALAGEAAPVAQVASVHETEPMHVLPD